MRNIHYDVAITEAMNPMNAQRQVPQYGRFELWRKFRANSFIALAVSVVAHLLVLTAYYLHNAYQGNDENAPVVRVKLMKYSELGPPPSIMNTDQLPAVGITVPIAKPTVGIPVPVPDVEVNPEQTIATQRELSQVQSDVVTEGTGNSNVLVEKDIRIEDDDPELEAFVPVEKFPMPVKQVKPQYPEIARRAGVEGTVWIKVLVTREGKVKKGVIIKSDVELFNEPAMQAALQWIFTPAMMNSGPVAVWVMVPFRFQLNKLTL